MLTVRVEVDRAVCDVAVLVVRDAHGQVEPVHKGDIVVVEAVATRNARERELGDSRGGYASTTACRALKAAVAAASRALGRRV